MWSGEIAGIYFGLSKSTTKECFTTSKMKITNNSEISVFIQIFKKAYKKLKR